MTQYATPDADSDNTGVWTTTPLWSKVDETGSPGDGTHIQSDSNPTSSEPFTVRLADISTPGSGDQIIRAEWSKATSGGATYRGVAQLREGYTNESSQGTLIATLTGTTISGVTDVQDSYTLSTAEKASIGDYNDLFLRCWAEKVGGGGPRGFKIDFVRFETPDGGTLYQRTFTGSVTPGSSSLGKSITHTPKGSVTPTGTAPSPMKVTRSSSGSVTPTGAVVRKTFHTLTGAVSSIVGTLANSLQYRISVSGAVTPGPSSMQHKVSAVYTGGVTPVGGKTRAAITHTVTGSVTPTGTLTKRIQITLVGAVTGMVGALTKSIAHTLTGQVTPGPGTHSGVYTPGGPGPAGPPVNTLTQIRIGR